MGCPICKNDPPWCECDMREVKLKQAQAEIARLQTENERLRAHMEEINKIVDECEYDKKTRKTVDRLRDIAKEAMK